MNSGNMNNDSQNNLNNSNKGSRTTFSLIAGFIVVLVLISVVAYRAGIDPKKIKQDVANFAQKITERYAARGMDVKLEYSDIAVKGGIFEKSIILQNASISVKGEDSNYKLQVPTAKIVPFDTHFDEMTIELASPVKMVKNDGAMQVSYAAKTPLLINIMLNEGGQREYLMPLPLLSDVEITNHDSVKKYAVSNNDTSFISGAFSDDMGDLYSVATAIEELKIVGEGAEIVVNSASIGSASEAGAGEFEFAISGLTSNNLPESVGAIDINLSQKSQVNAETKADDIDIELFSISGDGFDLNLKGRIAMRENELMPIANLNVVANGVAKIFAALGETKYFAPKQKNITIQAIKMIAPDWNEFSISPLQFDIRRDENAPFVIGKVKADELIAMIVQQYLQLQDVAPPVSAPAEIVPPSVAVPLSATVPSIVVPDVAPAKDVAAPLVVNPPAEVSTDAAVQPKDADKTQ